MANELLIAADAFTANISHEARYFFGVTAPYHTPSLIVADGQEGPYGASTWGPWKMANSGQLFTLLENKFIFAGIYASSDNGLTWAELDAANHIPSGVMTPFFDGDHTVIVAYRIAGAGQQQIRLKNFDLNTGTWGPVYADTGAPSCTALVTVVKRTDGTVFVGYDNAPPAPVPPASNFKGAVFSQASPGGTWTVTALDVGTNMAQLGGWIAFTKILAVDACFAMDTNGTLHFVFANQSSNLFGYQAVKIDNTLGPFHQFTDNLNIFSGSPLGHPVIVRGTLIIPATIQSGGFIYQTLYTATPLNAPVFTLMPSPGIDPSAPQDGTARPDNVWDSAYDPLAQILYAVWPRQSPGGREFGQLRLAQTSNVDPTQGWSAQTIFDLDLDSPPGFDFVGQEIQIPSAGIFAASASPVTPPLSPGGGGTPPPNRLCCPVDSYELATMLRQRRLKHGEAWPFKHEFGPPESIPVNELVSGALGAVGATVIVQTYNVPSGMKLMLHGLIENVNGVFTPGDILWTLDMNTPPTIVDLQAQGIQGLTTVPFPLGSLDSGRPWYFSRAYEFEPLTVIRSRAQNVSGVPGAPLISGLFGFLVPQKGGAAVNSERAD